jgi:hypothetical protein
VVLAPPGCLRLFDYAGGTLMRGVVVAPSGDHGFGPRHLDFHPTQPWAYVVLELQNRIAQFAFDRTTPHLVCERSTLTRPGEGGMRQAASTVHVHPNGQTVYVANRASSTTSMRSEGVAVGGENTIAVFAVDPRRGEPVRVQSIDAAGIHCRTFHIDPSPGQQTKGEALKPLGAWGKGHLSGTIGQDGSTIACRMLALWMDGHIVSRQPWCRGRLLHNVSARRRAI